MYEIQIQLKTAMAATTEAGRFAKIQRICLPFEICSECEAFSASAANYSVFGWKLKLDYYWASFVCVITVIRVSCIFVTHRIWIWAKPKMCKSIALVWRCVDILCLFRFDCNTCSSSFVLVLRWFWIYNCWMRAYERNEHEICMKIISWWCAPWI